MTDRRNPTLGAAWLLPMLVAVTSASAANGAADLSRRAQAYQLYAQAQMLLFDRQEESAVKLLEQAIERDPDPALLLETARAHDLLGHFERAIEITRKALAQRPGWAEAWSLLGDIHLGQARAGIDGDLHIERALEAYREAVRSDPDDQATVRALAEVCFQMGRIREAEEVLDRLASRRPLPPSLSLLQSRILIKTGEAEKAETILTNLVSRSPLNMEAVDALAGIYETGGRLEEALALYDPALRADIIDTGLFDRVGLLHLEAGHDREAIDFLERARRLDAGDARRLLPLAQAYEAVGEYQKAAEACEGALAVNPTSLETQFHHARLQRKMGNGEVARRGYDEMIRLAESRGKLTERETTLVTLASAQVGLLAMEVHDYAASSSAFARAAKLDNGTRPELVFLLARSLLLQGDLEGADRTAAEATERFPEALEMYVLRGEILLARGDEKAAGAYFKDLLKRQDSSVEAYVGVGEALMRSKRFADAEATLSDGLKGHKDDDRLLFAHGAALERLGRIDQAQQALAQAVAVNPDNAMALNYLGYLLADQGVRLRDSMSYVERALELDPENPAYLDSLGWVLFKLERYEPAEAKLRAALRYDATDPAIREHLGDLLVATGRDEEALREWEAALECGHEEPDRIREKMAKAKERIRSPH